MDTTLLSSLLAPAVISAIISLVFSDRMKAKFERANHNYKSKLELYQEFTKEMSLIFSETEYVFGLKPHKDKDEHKVLLQGIIMRFRLEVLTSLTLFAPEDVINDAILLTNYMFDVAYDKKVYEGTEVSRLTCALLNVIRGDLKLSRIKMNLVVP